MVSLAKILKKMENNEKQPHEIYSVVFLKIICCILTSCDGHLSNLLFKTLTDGVVLVNTNTKNEQPNL